MRTAHTIANKIFTLAELRRRVAQWRHLGRTVAFTNGCFDILHAGHIASLGAAAAQADHLIVGLNEDASVRQLKGPLRPVNREHDRALLVASLMMVDAVVLFGEPTPLSLILTLRPDVLVKGGDYREEDIVGAAEVRGWGGQVVINPTLAGYSTTGLIQKMKL